MTTAHERKQWSALSIVLLAMIALLVANQSRFLLTYPVPDTGMWFGDETWTMLMLRELARTGIARVPEAIGSSLAHSNGLINGSVWISGLFYGVPSNLFRHIASPVSIGRAISFLLALVSLAVIYTLARKLQAPREAAFVGIFALVNSGAFYFSSHSARLDIATGLAILLFFIFLLAAFERSQTSHPNIRLSFFIPLFAFLSLTIYVHVPALIALPALYTLWKIKSFHHRRAMIAMIAGATMAVALILGVYGITTGSLSLWGSGYNQYYEVVNSLPVLHLRSWRVQKINTIDRAIQVWQVAWPLVLVLAIGAIFRVRLRAALLARETFFIVNTVLLVLSWGLFGGPAVSYNIYILPVIAVCAAILLGPMWKERERSGKLWWVFLSIALLFSSYTIMKQERLGAVGVRLTRENDAAIDSLINPIANTSHPPLVLTDEPALNKIAGDPGVRLMTEHLLLFGGENLPFADILREHHVNYLLLYSTSRWHSPFLAIADSLYSLVGQRTGTLTDQARSYERPEWNETDTLRLYKAR